MSSSGAPVLFTLLESPVGRLVLAGEDGALDGIWIEGQRWSREIGAGWHESDLAFVGARDQLEQYFAGERNEFSLPLRFTGSEFQRSVWSALSAIPHGETRSYADIAAGIGRPAAVRAVGAANGRNPFAIVVPCHRVLGSDGSLVGYGGGLDRKRWLLEHERRAAGAQRVRRRLAAAPAPEQL